MRGRCRLEACPLPASQSAAAMIVMLTFNMTMVYVNGILGVDQKEHKK